MELKAYTQLNKLNVEFCEKLQKQLDEEIKQRELYRFRSLELEDAIKESVGVSLRNEVTKVECIFDMDEMAAMLDGTRFLIKEYYKSTSGVKFYISLIEKIEKNLTLMVKAKEDRNPKE